MKRISTVEDFSRCEPQIQKRSKPGVEDPLEDPSLPMSEKHRLASLWEVVQQNRQNHSKMLDLVRPMLHSGERVMSGPITEKATMPLSSGLQMACLYGDLNLVKMLVSRGENIDLVTMSPENFGRGRCPMSVAAELGHTAILKFLIDAGGDTKNMHDPPLRQAVHRKDLEAITMLVKGGADPDPTLHQLLWPKCDLSIIRMLLQAGARPWGTMLLTALWRGCEASVIEVLLEFGAPFRSDLENESALEVAICRGANRRTVEALLKANAQWSTKNHLMFPRTFRERVFKLCLLNNRFGKTLSSSILERVFFWLAVAEKRDEDRKNLQASLCNAFDLNTLERRAAAVGFGEIARQSEQSGNTSKTVLLQSLKTHDLLKMLWYEDAPATKPVYRSNEYVPTKNGLLHHSHGSESTLDGKIIDEESFGAPGENLHVDVPARQHEVKPTAAARRKRKPIAAPTIYVSTEGSAVGGYMGQQQQSGGNSNNNRRLAHPVADSRNLNSPKPHHCTCCHVCHVSMKQRPRPISACSACNTIICKICLQERWKTDQWEEACTTPNWVCHKCMGNCICKACKSKGQRGPEKQEYI